MIKNDIFQMTCTSLGSNMEGICHQDGMVVFVPGMLPGETSPVRIVKTQASYAFGILDGAPTSPSDTRITPDCGRCRTVFIPSVILTLRFRRFSAWNLPTITGINPPFPLAEPKMSQSLGSSPQEVTALSLSLPV